MRSSTLYGPVTKVTAGKYFAQVANKGLDKTGKEKGSEVKDMGNENVEKMKRREEKQNTKKKKKKCTLDNETRERTPQYPHSAPSMYLYCLFSFPITSSFFHAHSTIAPIAMLSLALIGTNTPSGHFVLCGMDPFLLFLCTENAQCDFGLGTTAV